MMLGQQVVKRVQGLQPQHLRVVDLAAPALAVKEPHPLEHALDAQKVAVRVLLRTLRQELPLPAADLDLERTRQVEVKRFRNVLHTKDVIINLFHYEDQQENRQPGVLHLTQSFSSW